MDIPEVARGTGQRRQGAQGTGLGGSSALSAPSRVTLMAGWSRTWAVGPDYRHGQRMESKYPAVVLDPIQAMPAPRVWAPFLPRMPVLSGLRRPRRIRSAADQGPDVLLDELKADVGEESGLGVAAVLHLVSAQCSRDALASNPAFYLTLERPCVSGEVEVPTCAQLPALGNVLGQSLSDVSDTPFQGLVAVVDDEVEIARLGRVDAALSASWAAALWTTNVVQRRPGVQDRFAGHAACFPREFRAAGVGHERIERLLQHAGDGVLLVEPQGASNLLRAA